MWLRLAPVNGGIPHAAVVRLHVHLGTDGALQAHRTALLHLLPQLQVLSGRVVPVLGLLSSLALSLKMKGKINESYLKLNNKMNQDLTLNKTF